ncbi:hypothetical protein [Devosia sp. CAU 1758]
MDTDLKTSAQPYELFMFARKHAIPLEYARAILARRGADRHAADMDAKKFGSGQPAWHCPHGEDRSPCAAQKENPSNSAELLGSFGCGSLMPPEVDC